MKTTIILSFLFGAIAMAAAVEKKSPTFECQQLLSPCQDNSECCSERCLLGTCVGLS
ncbi:hypothetical protein LTS08_003185 [Lithohypha guttulata]|uniref:Uncharacterized protein n=1 Tax=Lithohypha guttulata TaxID=1690604 RepID=A0AAN7YAK7_9EURO|nr:hypothetical protein LTR51_000157 [Lithohypha guttulata]KAK5085351.1 hypothetical protein LTR05_004635 [Lithohypha guttulata]KAK5103766.1 hypothetical protein LTS08_003185 [Lithohypha guttulata]